MSTLHRKRGVHWRNWNQVSVFPTPKRGVHEWCWPNSFLIFNRHRSSKLNIKSSVFPIPKRGGITGHRETKVSRILWWRHRQASSHMLEIKFQRLGDTQRPWSTRLVLSYHKAYMCWHKLITSLSVLSSDLFYFIIS